LKLRRYVKLFQCHFLVAVGKNTNHSTSLWRFVFI
jgi:hypothetical protein